MTTDEREIWRKLNECKAVKKVFPNNEWELGEKFIFGNKVQTVTEDSQNQFRNQSVRIIPLFDPIRPERSLIGIYKNITGFKCDDRTDHWLDEVLYFDRPDLALARAIIEQEGK